MFSSHFAAYRLLAFYQSAKVKFMVRAVLYAALVILLSFISFTNLQEHWHPELDSLAFGWVRLAESERLCCGWHSIGSAASHTASHSLGLADSVGAL